MSDRVDREYDFKHPQYADIEPIKFNIEPVPVGIKIWYTSSVNESRLGLVVRCKADLETFNEDVENATMCLIRCERKRVQDKLNER